MQSMLILIDSLVTLIVWALMLQVIMSWLVAFNIVNTQNKFVWQVNYALHKLTNPLLSPIKQILPNLGGIDISPIILIVVLHFARNLLFELLLGSPFK
ncbi:YggT family protein [Alphaproteobacteria bacterium]|jgi:YggT family protein|nr:YggT family protein [Alphaproteobacteria bacterium]